jgi:hypothetical protein
MLSKQVPLEKAIAMLRRHVEQGEPPAVSQSSEYLDRGGNLILVCVSIGRCREKDGSIVYEVCWEKYRGVSLDEQPYLDTRRKFPTLDAAIEWMEGKTGIPFSDFHR